MRSKYILMDVIKQHLGTLNFIVKELPYNLQSGTEVNFPIIAVRPAKNQNQ
jgi:hypothetical protein